MMLHCLFNLKKYDVAFSITFCNFFGLVKKSYRVIAKVYRCVESLRRMLQLVCPAAQVRRYPCCRQIALRARQLHVCRLPRFRFRVSLGFRVGMFPFILTVLDWDYSTPHYIPY